MKVKEQKINLWGGFDILMSVAYLSCWIMIVGGFMRYLCLDSNLVLYPISVQIILTIMTFVLIYYFAIKKANNSVSNFLGAGLSKKYILTSAFIATALLILSTTFIQVGVFEVTGSKGPELKKMLEPSFVLMFSSAAILISPFSEEVFFRGFLQPVLVKKLGVMIGVFSSALFFSLSHFNYIGYLSGFLGILAIGLILGFLRQKTSSLIPCIAAHLLNNIIAVMAMFVF